MRKTDLEGIQSLKVTTGIPQMPNMPPGSEKMLEAMYGTSGKIVAWIVPCDEHTVIFSYGNKEHVQEADGRRQGGQAGPGGRRQRRQGGQPCCRRAASWRFFCSPQGVLDFGKRVMFVAMPPGMNLNIPEFGETSPVAMAVKTGEGEVEFQMVVPVDVVKEVGRLIGSSGSVPGAVEQ